MTRYQIEHCNGPTIIRAQGYDPQMPPLEAHVKLGDGHCHILIFIGDDLAAMTTIWRGKAFAIRVARHMLMGVLSGLGRHRRLTANRAAKKVAEAKEGK